MLHIVTLMAMASTIALGIYLAYIRRRFSVSGRNSSDSRTDHCPSYWRRSILAGIDIIARGGLD
ncbi:hypothetical protein Tco_1288397, partial [Tanacetum coccineum]